MLCGGAGRCFDGRGGGGANGNVSGRPDMGKREREIGRKVSQNVVDDSANLAFRTLLCTKTLALIIGRGRN